MLGKNFFYRMTAFVLAFMMIVPLWGNHTGLRVVNAEQSGGVEASETEDDETVSEEHSEEVSDEAVSEEESSEEKEQTSGEGSSNETSEETTEDNSEGDSSEATEEESTGEESSELYEESSEEESIDEESEEASEEDSDGEEPEEEFIEEPVLAGASSVKVEETKADLQIIPDKYNTGCNDELTYFPMDTENPMMAGDVLIIPSGGGTTFVIDFGYRNTQLSGTVHIENYDFSACTFRSYNEDRVNREIKVVFNNCKFSSVLTGRAEGNLTFEFNNCTMNNFSGSNSVFNRCQFGHTFSDGLVPFVDIQVNDCFFTDFTGMVTDKGAHIDGTQIYGIADIDVSKVYYNNCRFEIPPLALEGTAAYVNACIMLQLEYSSGNNIEFTDCRVNGGGYTVYAESKFENLTFENVKFDGLTYGDAYKYGIFYPKINENIEFTGVSRTDSLYIGSVWKEENQTHFSVTNDTRQERELLIETDKGIYQYTIPACYVSSEFHDKMLYEEFPFDIDIVIPADCKYAVCYDNTQSGFGKQIRFVNWSDGDVYLSEEMVSRVASGDAKTEKISGSCGKEITFSLTQDGVLTLSGSGATYEYHSGARPDWEIYKDDITEIVVGEGITRLGNQIFRSHMSVEKVTLPDSLLSMGGYAFGGCVGLEEFAFPRNIEKIGGNALSGTVLRRVTYAGDDYDWDWVEVESGNDNWLEKLEVTLVGLRVRLATRNETFTYTGSAVKPDIVVFNNRNRLVEGVDYTVQYSNNVKVSTEKKPAKITVIGKGNLTGSNSTSFQILPKNIADEDVVAGSVVVVKGSKAKPVLTYGNITLGSADYTIEDATKKFTEDGTIIVRGKGNYTGTRDISVKVIEKTEQKSFTVTIGNEKLVYNAKSQKPTITVKDKKTGEVLREKKHYTITYTGNMINAGTVKVSVVGIGDYSGIVKKSYTIKPLAVKDGSIQISGINEKGYPFDPNGVTIGSGLKVTRNGTTLKAGVDYKVTYSNHKKVSKTKSPAKYTVSFIGNYKGSTSVKGTFMIRPAALSNNLSGFEVVLGDKVYTGKPNLYTSKPIVSVKGVLLKTSEYTTTYYKDSKLTDKITSKNKVVLDEGQESVKVYVKIVGKGNYAPSGNEYAKAEYQVCRKNGYDLSEARITLWENDIKITKTEYTGLAIEPVVKVEVKNGKVWEEVPADAYQVYYSNNINKGTASVTVSANGEDFAGSKTVKFKIVAKNIKSIKDLLNDLFGL